jgi:hypothetical protein
MYTQEYHKFVDDFTWSTDFFYNHIWPYIEPYIDGYIVKIENNNPTHVEKTLDVLAGIDCWHVKDDFIVRGVASRVQITKTAYNSFTIRMARDNGKMTEYEKRKYAIEHSSSGCVYPYITIQSYIASRSGPLLSCAVARTQDIIKFIDNGLHYTKRTSNATFAVCEWDKMIEYGFDVLIIIP